MLVGGGGGWGGWDRCNHGTTMFLLRIFPKGNPSLAVVKCVRLLRLCVAVCLVVGFPFDSAGERESKLPL